MRLTKQTMFAVRAMIYCAASEPELCRVRDIARAYGISELFLFKIVTLVAGRGLVETVRGRGGGIRLARPASEITLLDVVLCTEDGFALSECFERDGATCPHTGRCALHDALEAALDAFLRALGRYTIADLAGNPETMRTLLALDGEAADGARPLRRASSLLFGPVGSGE